MKKFNNHIYIKDDAIKNEHCDNIINLLNKSVLEKYEYYDGIKQINCYEQPWFLNYTVSLEEYKKKYTFFAKGNVGHWITQQACNYQKYNINQNYSIEHCEHGPLTNKRLLVWMFYCNDVKNGGETIFPQQRLKIQPKKGTLLMWPAGWTHSHYGAPCKEIKYIVTGWCIYL